MTNPPYGPSEPVAPQQGHPGPVPQPGMYGQPGQQPHHGPYQHGPYQHGPYQHGPYQQGPYQHMAPQPYPGAAYPPAHPLAPMQYKDTTAAYLLWFFTGSFGGHHFYLGRTHRGVAYAITCVLSWMLLFFLIGALGLITLFVLWVIDGVQLSDRLRQHNLHAYAVNQSMGYA
jgi:TM2 domain-containing membrane protein YozV